MVFADVVGAVEPDLASEAERGRAMQKVRSVLGSMPARQRSALEMAYFEGLSHSEIASKTGEPLGTVKTRIRGGVEKFSQAIQTRGDTQNTGTNWRRIRWGRSSRRRRAPLASIWTLG